MPIGVAVGILPWNFPFYVLSRKLAPALLTGCTIAVDRYRDAVLLACENAEPLEPSPSDAVAAGLQRMMQRMAKAE